MPQIKSFLPQSNIIMYTTEDGITKIEVTFDHDTVWLSIEQMAELFQRDKSVIGRHVRNIFKEEELVKEAVWAKFAYTASDGNILSPVECHFLESIEELQELEDKK